MTDINIPPKAVEAAAWYLWKNGYTPHRDISENVARAAIRAALAAWPGMNEENRNGFSFSPLPHGTAFRYTVIILPLLQESSDE